MQILQTAFVCVTEIRNEYWYSINLRYNCYKYNFGKCQKVLTPYFQNYPNTYYGSNELWVNRRAI